MCAGCGASPTAPAVTRAPTLEAPLTATTSEGGVPFVAIPSDTPGEVELAIAYDIGLDAGPSGVALAWALGDALQLDAEVLPSITLFRARASLDEVDTVLERLLSTASASVEVGDEVLEAATLRARPATSPNVAAYRLAMSSLDLPSIESETAPTQQEALAIRQRHYGKGRVLVLAKGDVAEAQLGAWLDRSGAGELREATPHNNPEPGSSRFVLARSEGLNRAAAFILIAPGPGIAAKTALRAERLGLRSVRSFGLRRGFVVSGELDTSSEAKMTSQIARLRWLAEAQERQAIAPTRSLISRALMWANDGSAPSSLGIGLIEPPDQAPLPDSIAASLSAEAPAAIRVETTATPGPDIVLTLVADTHGDTPAALGLGALTAEVLAGCEADFASLEPISTTRGWGVLIRAARLSDALDAIAVCVVDRTLDDREVADASLRLRARLSDLSNVALNRSWASFALAPLDRGCIATHGAMPAAMSLSAHDVRTHLSESLVSSRLAISARGAIEQAQLNQSRLNQSRLNRGLSALFNHRPPGAPVSSRVRQRGQPRAVSHIRHSGEHVVMTWDHADVSKQAAEHFVERAARYLREAGYRVRYAEAGRTGSSGAAPFGWAAIGVEASLERRDALVEHLVGMREPGFTFASTADEPGASALLRSQVPRFVMSAPELPRRR